MSKVARSSRGMVVAAHRAAAEAGHEVLAAGGNAVEAAVAVSLAIQVVEPFASGLGGGGFLLVAPGGDPAKAVVLDFRGTCPSIQSPEHFYPKGATLPWVPKIGPSSATVPGLGRALGEMLRRWGGKLPLATLARRAIEVAEQGFEVGENYEYVSGLFEGTVRCFPDAARIYFNQGRRYRPGERLVQRDLGRTFRKIVAEGFEVLYTGEIGRAITAAVNATGPVWGEKDLESYEVKVREPLRGEIAGASIATVGPPSRGGPGILAALRHFHERDLPSLGHNTAASVLAWGEAIRRIFHELEPVVGDPAFFPAEPAAPGKKPTPGSPSTTHFTVVDAGGTVVAMSQTIGHFFGSGVVVPGWGILLNDDISDMERRAGGRNSVRPGLRSVANMAPTVVFRGGRPALALGTPGSLRIFPAMAQVIANWLLHGLDLEKSVAAGRVHWEDEIFWLEGDLDPAVREAVKAAWKGRIVERRKQDLFFGGVHAVSIDPDGTITGVADPRRDGVALGL